MAPLMPILSRMQIRKRMSDNDNNTGDTTGSETVEDEEEATVEVEQEPFSNVVDVNVVANSGTALSQALENLTDLEIDSVLDEDYYKFVVDSDEQVDLSVKFSHSDGDLDANLYNSKDCVVKWSILDY